MAVTPNPTAPVVEAQDGFQATDAPVHVSHMWFKSAGQVVVLSDAHFNLQRFAFNATGSRVWEMMDGNRTVAEIIDTIHHSSGSAAREQVAQDVGRFLAELRTNWLAMSQEELKSYE